MISLTPRQQDALRFIIGFQKAKGFSPSYAEIGDGIGLSGENSKQSVYRLMGGLEERGYIRRRAFSARAIEVLQPIAIPRAPDGAPLRVVPVGGQS